MLVFGGHFQAGQSHYPEIISNILISFQLIYIWIDRHFTLAHKTKSNLCKNKESTECQPYLYFAG